MTANLEAVARARSELVSKSLTRHRLVFVQAGAAFDPIRESLLDNIHGHRTSVDQRDEWKNAEADSGSLIVYDLERCAGTAADVLGEVRELVFSILDDGRQVCLVSRAPRISFQAVPGSSILEDAALVTLPLLSRPELDLESTDYPSIGWKWPCVSFGAALDVGTYEVALQELGQGLVAALDHALFEVSPKSPAGLEFLSAREIEGLRGSGIVELGEDNAPALAEPGSLKMLREAVASHISAVVTPATILPTVSSGLWFVERKIRSALRSAAIQKYGEGWRASCLGGLSTEVLKRAQLDACVAAKSVTDLRDPLEWLTMGELMDLVRSEKFDHLGIDPVIWRKLQEQLVPIRNRLAHVRMLKAGDDEMVSMWANVIRSRFGV